MRHGSACTKQLSASVQPWHEPTRARCVDSVGSAECLQQQSLFVARPQVAAKAHDDECGPRNGALQPDGGAECKQVECDVDRMPHDAKDAIGE